MIKDQTWLDARQKAIGGSDAAAVLGINPFKTSLRLWKEKRGEIAADDLEDNEAVLWGTLLEPVIAKEYARRTGYSVNYAPKTYIHPQLPWMQCNLDFEVTGTKAKLIGEIKAVGYYHYNAAEWGPEGSSLVPIYYFAQAQHNIAVTGADQCDMPCLIAGNMLRVYRIPRDEHFIATLIEAETEFQQSISTGAMPPAVNLADLKILFPEGSIGMHREATEKAAEAWARLCDVKKRIKSDNAYAETQEFIIKGEMGDAEILSFNGVELATWKCDKNKVRRFKVKSPSFSEE